MQLIILTLGCKGLLISDRCHVRFATLVDKKGGVHDDIIPTQCFYRFFGDFDWSVGKMKWFLHFNKNPRMNICLDFTVLTNCTYIKLRTQVQVPYCCVRDETFTSLNIVKHVEISFENPNTV